MTTTPPPEDTTEPRECCGSTVPGHFTYCRIPAAPVPAAEDDAVERAIRQALDDVDLTDAAVSRVARAALDAAGVPALQAEVARMTAQNRRLIVSRNTAQQQVADLRAGIEALAAEAEALPYTKQAIEPSALRAALAGSGEQTGDLNPDAPLWGYRAAQRPAPVVPDSTDLRERVAVALGEVLAPTGVPASLVRPLTGAVLAVVRPDGVSAEQALLAAADSWERLVSAGHECGAARWLRAKAAEYRADSPAGGAS